MIDLIAKTCSDEELEIMKLAFNQKGEEFLLKLTFQLEALNRWQWLRK